MKGIKFIYSQIPNDFTHPFSIYMHITDNFATLKAKFKLVFLQTLMQVLSTDSQLDSSMNTATRLFQAT